MFVSCGNSPKSVEKLQEGVNSVWSSGHRGRRTTGHTAVVLRAVLLLLVGVAVSAGVQAGDRMNASALQLPRLRMDPTVDPRAVPAASAAVRIRPAGAATLRLERAPTRFYDAYLMPELRSKFDSIGAPYSAMPGVGDDLGEFVMYDSLTASARAGVQSATGRALRDYLIERSGVDRLLELAPHPKTSVSTGRRGATLGVDGRGSVDVRFDRTSTATYSGVALSLQPNEDAYGVSYRVRF